MAKPPAQLKKPDFSGFVAGKLSGRTCGQLCGNQKTMAFVPASGMAERPKQLWTSKIRANVPASGTAKDVNLLRPSQNMDIFQLQNVVNANVNESWHISKQNMLHSTTSGLRQLRKALLWLPDCHTHRRHLAGKWHKSGRNLRAWNMAAYTVRRKK